MFFVPLKTFYINTELFWIFNIYSYLCGSSLKLWGRYRHLIPYVRNEWHVGAGLTPYNLIQISNGKTISKLSTLGFVREESVVAI
jgi:hypothetical protein